MAAEQRGVEVRSPSGKLVGMLYPGAGLFEVKRGAHIFELDLVAAASGRVVVFERVLQPGQEGRT